MTEAKVQRYTMRYTHCKEELSEYSSELIKDDCGEWIKREDHEEIVNGLKAYIRMLEHKRNEDWGR